jgi:ABC-type transport system involved in multi-copper enzyme maturation permease subunit
MRPTLSLIRREFSAYFLSPIAYVVLAIFLAVTGHLFYLSLELLTAHGPKGLSYPMELIVNSVPFWLVFLALAPLLTMRLFAEERSTGTLEMLLTAPLRDWQVVFAKFVACYAFYVIMWLPTLLYLPILANWQIERIEWSEATRETQATYAGIAVVWGLAIIVSFVAFAWNLVTGQLKPSIATLCLLAILLVVPAYSTYVVSDYSKCYVIECGIDPIPIATTYLGLALAGAMFLAIGLFVSSLVNSQMVAALVSIFLGLLFVVGGIWRPDLDTSSMPFRVLSFLTVPMHFESNFGRGVIDTRNLILYSSVAVLGLFLTVRSVESRRWR